MRRKTDKRAGKAEDSTVVFVPSTTGGTLVRKLREREEVMRELTGFGIKFQEAGGTQLKNSFSLDLGKGTHCGRECPPCTSNGEKRQRCRARNIVYETLCTLCNPETNRMEKRENEKAGRRKGIYIGESSRSIHERSREHERDAEGFSKKSHLVKHWMECHPEETKQPPFRFRIVRQYRDCMSRQIGEAIEIQRSGDELLNSKCEYLQNCITRITVNEETWERKERERREEESEKEEELRLEAFKLEKLSTQGAGKRKRKASCLEREEAVVGIVDIGLSTGDEKRAVPSLGKSDEQHQLVNMVINESSLGDAAVVDMGLATCVLKRAMPSLGLCGEQLQHVDQGMGYHDPEPSEAVVDMGLAPCGMERAVPSLSLGGDIQHQRVDRALVTGSKKLKMGAVPQPTEMTKNSNSSAVQHPKNTKKVEKKRKDVLHLNYWNMWWQRMEREGAKEERERRIVNMQRPANSFFSKEGSTNIRQDITDTLTDRIQTTQNSENIDQVETRSTPVKRKCDLWMDLEDISELSTVGSPAKRQRQNFKNLLKYWDGGGGRGKATTISLKDEPQKPKIHIHINTHSNHNLEIGGSEALTRKAVDTKLDTNTHGGGGGESESCQGGVADWSGGGG